VNDFIWWMAGGLVVVLCMSIHYYPERREKIETTCVKESKLKTFFDEFVINLLFMIPVYSTLFIMFTIFGAFEK
jgi:hypothetical protein